MHLDSTINRYSGLFVLVSGFPLFASNYSEIKEVIGLITNDIHIDQGQI
jgi:hypothetical protein